MNRRDFISSTGTIALGGGVAIKTLSRSALAFETKINNKASIPEDINNPQIELDFDKFEIIANNIKDVTITLNASLEDNNLIDGVDSVNRKLQNPNGINNLTDISLSISDSTTGINLNSILSEKSEGQKLNLNVEIIVENNSVGTISTGEKNITISIISSTIPDDMVYYYKFENDYRDNSGKYDLTPVTNSFDNTSKYGTYAFSKDTTGYKFAEGDNSFWTPFNSTNEITVTGWVQPFQTDQNYSDIFTNKRREHSGTDWRFGIGNVGNGNQLWRGSGFDILGGPTLSTTSYTFFALRASSITGDANVRLNKTTELSSSGVTDFDFAGAGVNFIGAGGADGRNDTWKGRIDDIRFFNRFLSDEECDEIRAL